MLTTHNIAQDVAQVLFFMSAATKDTSTSSPVNSDHALLGQQTQTSSLSAKQMPCWLFLLSNLSFGASSSERMISMVLTSLMMIWSMPITPPVFSFFLYALNRGGGAWPSRTSSSGGAQRCNWRAARWSSLLPQNLRQSAAPGPRRSVQRSYFGLWNDLRDLHISLPELESTVTPHLSDPVLEIHVRFSWSANSDFFFVSKANALLAFPVE